MGNRLRRIAIGLGLAVAGLEGAHLMTPEKDGTNERVRPSSGEQDGGSADASKNISEGKRARATASRIQDARKIRELHARLSAALASHESDSDELIPPTGLTEHGDRSLNNWPLDRGEIDKITALENRFRDIYSGREDIGNAYATFYFDEPARLVRINFIDPQDGSVMTQLSLRSNNSDGVPYVLTMPYDGREIEIELLVLEDLEDALEEMRENYLKRRAAARIRAFSDQ